MTDYTDKGEWYSKDISVPLNKPRPISLIDWWVFL